MIRAVAGRMNGLSAVTAMRGARRAHNVSAASVSSKPRARSPRSRVTDRSRAHGCFRHWMRRSGPHRLDGMGRGARDTLRATSSPTSMKRTFSGPTWRAGSRHSSRCSAPWRARARSGRPVLCTTSGSRPTTATRRLTMGNLAELGLLRFYTIWEFVRWDRLRRPDGIYHSMYDSTTG